jgi:hypothetical protein
LVAPFLRRVLMVAWEEDFVRAGARTVPLERTIDKVRETYYG